MLNLGASRMLRRIRTLTRYTVGARIGAVAIPRARGISEVLFTNEEPWLDGLLGSLLASRRGPVLDIGASIGQTLIKIVNVDRRREYWGFEPNPSSVAYINELKAANGLADVHVVCAALSDHEGMARLFLSSPSDSSGSIVAGFRPPSFYTSDVVVPTMCGDTAVGALNIRDVAVLKIDVEGAELDVLRGLQATIRRDRPVVICEMLPVYDEQTDVGRLRRARTGEVVRLVHDLGYVIDRLLPDGTCVRLMGIETHADLSLTNYVLRPSEGASGPV